VDDHWFVMTQGDRVSAVGYGVENFVIGRFWERLRSLSFPKGPVAVGGAALATALRLIESAARAQRAVYIDIQPQWGDAAVEELERLASEGGWIAVTPAPMTLQLDLTSEFGSLFARIDKSARYEIRRAHRLGIEVGTAAAARDYEAFYDCYRQTGLRKGFDALDRETYFGLVSRIKQQPSRGALIVAHLGGTLLGGIIVLRAGRCLHYVYGASTNAPSMRKLPIGYLLQWRAIEWARELRLNAYDFGGYSLDADNTVAKFKAKFGGSPVRLGRRYRRILRPRLYSLADRLKQLGAWSGCAARPIS
jgi:hypothetical protein